MNIVIPEILAGGVGRAFGGMASGVRRVGNTVAQVVMQVEKNVAQYENQQALIEASSLENDMLLEKRAGLYELSKNDDGTDTEFLKKAKEADERIGQTYISRAKSDQSRNYLTKVHFLSQKTNLMKAQEGQEGRLWDASLSNVKIQTDNIIRKTAPFADYDSGVVAVDSYVSAQSGYFGARTEDIKASMLARYTENMIMASLADPVAAPVMLRKLNDETERGKMFSNIPGDRIDNILNAAQRANHTEATRHGMTAGVNVFKSDTTGSLEKMTDSVRALNMGADAEKAAVLQIKELFNERHIDKERQKVAAIENINKILVPIALKRNGINKSSDLSPEQWSYLTDRAPEYASRLQDNMRRELDTQTKQNKTDRINDEREKKQRQADNEGALLVSDDFTTRDLKSDLAAGDISPAQYLKLTKVQSSLDPIKRDSVRSALSKINAGSALGNALGVKGKSDEAAWKLKYGDLVKAWAYNHADDPDFDRKMTEFVEKQVLSKMVTSWFSGDDSDREAKFNKAKSEAGDMPQRNGRQPSAGGDKKRAAAIKILEDNKKPVTDANINHVMGQL